MVKDITLVDWYGELHKLRKAAPDEKRPKVMEEKDGTMLWSKIREADYSVAWTIRIEDYAAKSKKFLADGLPKDRDTGGAFGMANQRFSLADHIIDAARHAHFTHQLGHHALAGDLFHHARKAHKKYSDSYSGGFEKPGEILEFVVDRLATDYRNSAIYSGHGGTPRKDLQKRWEKIAAIPHHRYRDDAEAMAKHYEGLLREDVRWVEPNVDAIARMTTDQKVAYWLCVGLLLVRIDHAEAKFAENIATSRIGPLSDIQVAQVIASWCVFAIWPRVAVQSALPGHRLGDRQPAPRCSQSSRRRNGVRAQRRRLGTLEPARHATTGAAWICGGVARRHCLNALRRNGPGQTGIDPHQPRVTSISAC